MCLLVPFLATGIARHPFALRFAPCLIHLIETEGVTSFFVGNQGAFDAAVQSVLRDLQSNYPAITCTVVLAYMPRQPENDGLATMLPEGIEKVPKRFAISWRQPLDAGPCGLCGDVCDACLGRRGPVCYTRQETRKTGLSSREESVGHPQALI